MDEIIIKDCDKCVLKIINCSNSEGFTICAIDKLADTFRCTYGMIPINCPLRKGAITIKLDENIEVMKNGKQSKT